MADDKSSYHLIDYYFVDNSERLKNIKSQNHKDWILENEFYLFIENKKGIFIQDIYNKKDFDSYSFIVIENPENNKKVGFVYQKDTFKDIFLLMNKIRGKKYEDVYKTLRIKSDMNLYEFSEKKNANLANNVKNYEIKIKGSSKMSTLESNSRDIHHHQGIINKNDRTKEENRENNDKYKNRNSNTNKDEGNSKRSDNNDNNYLKIIGEKNIHNNKNDSIQSRSNIINIISKNNNNDNSNDTGNSNNYKENNNNNTNIFQNNNIYQNNNGNKNFNNYNYNNINNNNNAYQNYNHNKYNITNNTNNTHQNYNNNQKNNTNNSITYQKYNNNQNSNINQNNNGNQNNNLIKIYNNNKNTNQNYNNNTNHNNNFNYNYNHNYKNKNGNNNFNQYHNTNNNTNQNYNAKNINNKINNNQNYNNNQNNYNYQNYNNNNKKQVYVKPKYIFSLKGLDNIGSTCYMNSTLQCLLHVNELVNYFLYEYKNDKTTLKRKNKNAATSGEISDVFFDLVIGVYQDNNNENISETKISSIFNPKTSNYKSQINNLYEFKAEKNSISPNQFKRTLGFHNPQFKDFKANDSKDLLLYLLQTMHEELNYFGDNPPIRLPQPNQCNRESTFMYFMNFYNNQNFSIISKNFYGTYETITKCKKCKTTIYNFQKFEFISFGMFKYKKKTFDIMNGFKDNEEPQELKGDNKFYCNKCGKLVEALLTCKIIQPPNKLIINIDYGKDKKYQPSNILFGDIINITNYVNFNFGTQIRYEITGICTHFGSSGKYGHYITFCKHKEKEKWYSFSDSSCKEIKNKDEIYTGSPYILLYEKLN